MADTPEPWLEIRPRDDGSFDEVVARFPGGAMVHIETLDDKSVYVGIHKDGPIPSAGLQLWISSNAALSYGHADMGSPPAGIDLNTPRDAAIAAEIDRLAARYANEGASEAVLRDVLRDALTSHLRFPTSSEAA